MRDEAWPALPYEAWKDTYDTLHLFTQVIGKVALARMPPINHSWGIAFTVTPRGLSTRTLPHGARSFAIELDFVDHRVVFRVTDGETRALPLAPMTVADFYRAVMKTLDELGLPVHLWPVSVERPVAVRLDEDTEHRSYDPEYANRHWRILTSVERVLSACRCGFVGKCSPVHFFWGSFDLAVTRFSGRRAPDREGPAFMRDAYSHEVISHGFWPGSGPLLEPAFYAYAVPPPAGFEAVAVAPAAAYWHKEMGEFVLPYEAVRAAPEPEEALRLFVDSTYAGAADLAGWDRAALERPVGSPGAPVEMEPGLTP